MSMDATDRLLRRTSRRRRAAFIATHFTAVFYLAAAVYAVSLALSRLLGVIPDWFPAPAALFPVALAAASALLFHRRPSRQDTAHAIDAAAATGDLVLTKVLLADCPQDYAPIVHRQALDACAGIKAADVVPLRWQRAATRVLATSAVLAMASAFLPQFDPFGREEQRQELVAKQRKLADTRKAAALRKATLEARDPERPHSEKTQKLLDAVKLTFNSFKPADQAENAKQIAQKRKIVADQWRKTNEERLRKAMDANPAAQKFGGLKNSKLAQWKQQLNEGSAAALKNEFDELKKLAEALKRETDPDRKRQLKRELSQKLKQMADFAKNEAGAAAFAASLERAMKQLGMTDMDKLSKEALEALQESLDLAKMEAGKTAQTMRDMQALEKAMQALQMARKCNAQGKACPDGEPGQGKTLDDYMEYYAEVLAEMAKAEGEGEGEGQIGGKGHGKGGIAPEDDSAKSDFTDEQDRAKLQSGKLLLKWKTKGTAPKGEAREEYIESVRRVKQGVNEAIEREAVPPGYHSTIRTYFNTLDRDDGGSK